MEDRTVLVTGANSGIGLATALEVARRGFRTVGSVRSTAKAAAVRRAAREAGVEVHTVLLDVTDAAACRRVVGRLRPWGLVNNAGASFTGAVEDVDDDEVRAAMETMVVAPMRLARLSLPHMRKQGGGRIVNVSSIYGRTSTPLTGWYQGAKHALEAVSDAMRMEVASEGIKVILVEPGSVDTGLWDDAGQAIKGRAGSRYQRAYRRSLQGMELSRPFMPDPFQVASIIGRALTVRSPAPRYLVGFDARAAAALERALPTSIKDRIIRLTLGL
jgi:NAD(P)-dependent dehydrogenase (short-subunit alcohol dehydrogenase family)